MVETQVPTANILTAFALNPLSPNSDKHLISPYNISTWSNIQVTRIKEMITKHKMS